VGQQRYYPYGAGRPTDTTLPTDYRFTGQRREGTIGLYDYGARFYDPALGRFLSADTVVPKPGNPQALNRYAYVLNNPLKYTDPTGHWVNQDWKESDRDIEKRKGNWVGISSEGDPATYPAEWGCKGNPDSVWVAVAAPFMGVGTLAGFDLFYMGGAAVGEWIMTHPLQAHVVRAVGEEAVESTVTKTPFDPMMVAWDLFTVFGDDMIPRRTSDGAKLERWFAVQQLAGEPGEVIAGGGPANPYLRDWPRLVATYGDLPGYWAKMVGPSYTCNDGFNFQLHWYENLRTGMRVEFKPKIGKPKGR